MDVFGLSSVLPCLAPDRGLFEALDPAGSEVKLLRLCWGTCFRSMLAQLQSTATHQLQTTGQTCCYGHWQ